MTYTKLPKYSNNNQDKLPNKQKNVLPVPIRYIVEE